jgi:hypothetical protein
MVNTPPRFFLFFGKPLLHNRSPQFSNPFLAVIPAVAKRRWARGSSRTQTIGRRCRSLQPPIRAADRASGAFRWRAGASGKRNRRNVGSSRRIRARGNQATSMLANAPDGYAVRTSWILEQTSCPRRRSIMKSLRLHFGADVQRPHA